MPWFARRGVEFGCGVPVIVDGLALENDDGPGSEAVQDGVDAYEPEGIGEDTLVGTVGSEDAAVEGEDGKLDAVDGRCIQDGDNVRGL